MQYTPDYTLQLKSGQVIPLLFNSWTYRTFCQRKGFDLDTLLRDCFDNKVLKSENLTDILYVAHQSFCKFNNKTFAQNEEDAFVWVDELGGYYNKAAFVPLVKVFIQKLANIGPESFEQLWQTATENGSKAEQNTEQNEQSEDAEDDKKKVAGI